MTTDLHTLSGAYAVDALSGSEVSDFDTHLAQCASCRIEVAELREAAAQMGLAEAAPAPRPLKARVLEAADRTPQLPPRVSSTDELASRRDAREGRRSRWLAGVAAAALLVTGTAVGVASLSEDDEPVVAAGVSQVFEAPDHRVATLETDYGMVQVGRSDARGEMALDASRLAKLDDGDVYQVWAVRDGNAEPVTAITDKVAGAAMPLPREGTVVAITVEPVANPEVPSSEPIVSVDPRTV